MGARAFSENATQNAGGGVAVGGDDWILGNVVFDRDVWGGAGSPDFGISLEGGFVRFGTGRGTAAPLDRSENTMEGNVQCLDGA
ncbi:MAG: hypothetical protein JNJ88_21385 [Planctomycetes bacterium]|nr:hypothetical protein [Planctomycetota bacterium]